ncbi:protein NPGR2 [Argentina anserina]|uniref:protein NPGR2 n=1 Tax=Argentina anserina TaxID=57926 RepID=UPI0021766BCB|nr:protein NPGR2 [Potentilla anserina]
MTRSRNERGSRSRSSGSFGMIMNCFCSGEQLKGPDELIFSDSESLATRDHKSEFPLRVAAVADKSHTNIIEAESSLRESGGLNYEEARALLGRCEYRKGNIELALHVFEGIDIAAVTPKIKVTLARAGEHRRRRSRSNDTPPMSLNAVCLLLEAIYLKAKSLQSLGKLREAAQSCGIILDTVESSLPGGLPQSFGTDCKLHDIVSQSVELLPELWKFADCQHEAILSYRRALLSHWNLDTQTTAKIQKEFAIFLLYCGDEATPPHLRFQMDRSFTPKSNLEEAILLLMILIRKVSLKRIEWDPSILDHLSFALSVSGNLRALATQYEELLPGLIDRKEGFYNLSLCYYGAGEGSVALDLLRKLLANGMDPMCFPALLMASKICGENQSLAKEGVGFALRALESVGGKCDELKSTASCVLGISLSAHSKSAVTDGERLTRQAKALEALKTAGQMTAMSDPIILYHLSLEYAQQRKLDAALDCAKQMLNLEAGSSVKGWLLLSRILSAQRRFVDAETIIDGALDQTGKWDQGELLQTKAKLQLAEGQFKRAIETYTQLLALLQVQTKGLGYRKKLLKSTRQHVDRSLELEIWHDLAHVYMSLSQWNDAEICLFKSKGISTYSAARCHATGVLYEKKGLYKEAVKAFSEALTIDPSHIPSLVSLAVVLKRLGSSEVVVKSLLMNALSLDRMNHSAWFNLGLLYKSQGTPSSLSEAAECFEAAVFLEDSTPVEPFR